MYEQNSWETINISGRREEWQGHKGKETTLCCRKLEKKRTYHYIYNEKESKTRREHLLTNLSPTSQRGNSWKDGRREKPQVTTYFGDIQHKLGFQRLIKKQRETRTFDCNDEALSLQTDKD